MITPEGVVQLLRIHVLPDAAIFLQGDGGCRYPRSKDINCLDDVSRFQAV